MRDLLAILTALLAGCGEEPGSSSGGGEASRAEMLLEADPTDPATEYAWSNTSCAEFNEGGEVYYEAAAESLAKTRTSGRTSERFDPEAPEGYRLPPGTKGVPNASIAA